MPAIFRSSFAAVVLAFALAPLAHAATVTQPGDSGAGTLRQAVADAAPGDTIALGTDVTLGASTVVIDKPLTIQVGSHTILSSGAPAFDIQAAVSFLGRNTSPGTIAEPLLGGSGNLFSLNSSNTQSLTLHDLTIDGLSTGGAPASVVVTGSNSTLNTDTVTFSGHTELGTHDFLLQMANTFGTVALVNTTVRYGAVQDFGGRTSMQLSTSALDLGFQSLGCLFSGSSTVDVWTSVYDPTGTCHGSTQESSQTVIAGGGDVYRQTGWSGGRIPIAVGPADSSAGTPNPTGAVALYDGEASEPLSGAVTPDGGGAAHVDYPLYASHGYAPALGDHTIRARYLGGQTASGWTGTDPYNPSLSQPTTLHIVAAPTLSMTQDPATGYQDGVATDVAVRVTAADGLPLDAQAQGAVHLTYDGTTQDGTLTGGLVVFSITPRAGGGRATVAYDGSDVYSSKSGTFPVAVRQPAVIGYAHTGDFTVGQGTPITVTIGDGSDASPTPTETPTVSLDGTATLTGQTTDTDGSRTFSFTVTPASTASTLTIDYPAGDAALDPNTDNESMSVTGAAPHMTLAADPTSARAGDIVTLAATVTGVTGLPAPTGSVTFRENGSATPIDTVAVGTDGTASTTVTVGTGSHDFLADYDDTSSPSVYASTTKGVTVPVAIRPTTTAVTATPTTVHAAAAGDHAEATDPVSVHVAVSTDDAAVVPDGTVTLSRRGGAETQTVTLDADGTATATLDTPHAGTGPLTAAYAGTSDYATSTASTPLRVGLDPVTIAFDPVPASATSSQPITVTGTIRATDLTAGAIPQDAPVTLLDGPGGPVLATATVASTPGGDGAQAIHATVTLSPGNHQLVWSLHDPLSRFADTTQASATSVGVHDASACYQVGNDLVTVPTRGDDGRSTTAPVTVRITPATATCGFSGLGVRYGGTIALAATPPRYEQVTGFTVTPQGGGASSTLALDAPADAGITARAALTLTSNVIVRAITVERPPPCTTVTLASRWKGETATRPNLASGYKVAGQLGCALTEDDVTQAVGSDGSVQALPGTPLNASATGVNVAPLGPTTVASWAGVAADGSFTTPTVATTLTAEMRATCFAEPQIVDSQGGTVARTTTSLATGTDARLSSLASGLCPAAWGTGVLPGAHLGYAATPLAFDSSLGIDRNDTRSAWWMDSWHQSSSTTDLSPTAAATTLASALAPTFTASYQDDSPVRTCPRNPDPCGGPAHRTFTLDEPALPADGKTPSHPVAVGAQFYRLGCATIKLDAVTGARAAGDSGVGSAVRGALGTGSLSISPAPNCVGGGYKPGTKVTITAADPSGMDSAQVITTKQHPEAWNGKASADAYTGAAGAAALAVTASTRRATPPKKTKKGGRRGPRHAPPAAPRLVTAARTIARARHRTSSARTKVHRARSTRDRLLSRERTTRDAFAAAQRSGDGLKAAAAAWSEAFAAAAKSYDAAIRASDALTKAQIAGAEQVALAQYRAGGQPADDSASELVRYRGTVATQRLQIAYVRWQLAVIEDLVGSTQAAVDQGADAVVQGQLGLEQARLTGTRQLLAQAQKDLATYQAGLARLQAITPAVASRAETRLLRTVSSAPAPSLTPATDQTAPAAHAASAADDAANAVANAGGARPPYPDETDTHWRVGTTNYSQFSTPVAYRGMWGAQFDNGDDDGAIAGHTATLTTGPDDTTIHATWTPVECERPQVVREQPKLTATISIDGGAGACAGPGTVRRLGTFAVTAVTPGPYVPVLISSGTSPDGSVEKHIAVGNSASFPALPNTKVDVQLCQPIEFGGSVTDTGHGLISGFEDEAIAPASDPLTAEQISGFIDSADECAVPGLFKARSTVKFKNAFTLGNAKNAWTVDGQDVGTTPPTVTLDDAHPEHAVGLQTTVSCVRVYYKTTYSTFTGQPHRAPGFDRTPDCPVAHDSFSHAGEQAEGRLTSGETLAYFAASGSLDPTSHGITSFDSRSVSMILPPANPLWDWGWSGNSHKLDCSPTFSWDARAERWELPDPVRSPAGYSDIATRYGLYADTAVAIRSCDVGAYDHTSYSLPSVGYPPYSSLGDLILLPYGGAEGSYIQQLAQTFSTNPFQNPQALLSLGENLAVFGASAYFGPEVLLAAPQTLDFVKSTVDNLPTAFSDPANFGRFAGSFAVGLGSSVIQSKLGKLGSAGVLLKLGAADTVVSGSADLLADVGAPDGLTRTIRSARILTNGMNAITNCSSNAAAGNPPPLSTDQLSGVDVATLYKSAKDFYKSNAAAAKPPPLTRKSATLDLNGAVGGQFATLKQTLASKGKQAATPLITALSQFTGAGHNWTADEYLGCLAANTVGAF